MLQNVVFKIFVVFKLTNNNYNTTKQKTNVAGFVVRQNADISNRYKGVLQKLQKNNKKGDNLK